jgi:hypothetical protein
MATRSTIAIEYADGTVDQIYCHWDGYLENNGAILRDHYSDPFKLRELVELGDISSLRPEIGTAHPFSQFEGKMDGAEYDKLYGDMTTFYGRDRGETGTGAKRFKDFQEYAREHQREEYEYILRQVNGKAQWFVSFYGTDDEYLTIEDAFEFQAAKNKEYA